jgi:hypothetical protein
VAGVSTDPVPVRATPPPDDQLREALEHYADEEMWELVPAHADYRALYAYLGYASKPWSFAREALRAATPAPGEWADLADDNEDDFRCTYVLNGWRCAFSEGHPGSHVPARPVPGPEPEATT